MSWKAYILFMFVSFVLEKIGDDGDFPMDNK